MKEEIVYKEHVVLRILGFNTHNIFTAHKTVYDYFHHLDELTDEAILHSAITILNDCYLERRYSLTHLTTYSLTHLTTYLLKFIIFYC